MKKFKFTIRERLELVRLLNGFKGSLSQLTAILEDLKVLKLTDKEIKDIEGAYVQVQGGTSFQWNEKKAEKVVAEIPLQIETMTFIKEHIDEKDKKKEITMDDVELIHIKDLISKE